MAIYGIGANWDGYDMTDDFISNNQIEIGWSKSDAEDLYNLLASFKVGDIVFIKSNQPGSLDVTVKAIGIVCKSVINSNQNRNQNTVGVIWKNKVPFKLQIPTNTGKLTNIRAATIYEEFHPYVQNEIIKRL